MPPALSTLLVSPHPDWNSTFFWHVLDATNAGVLVINRAYEVVFCNRHLCEQFTGIPARELTGRSLTQFKTLPDEEMDKVANSMSAVFEEGRSVEIENWALHRDGSRRRIHWRASPLFDGNGGVRYLVSVGQDVTRQRELEARLETLAHFDALTGLSNRPAFYARLGEEARWAQAGRTTLGVIYLDLDGFKAVNDQYGHEAGDAVLREVAARLTANLRQSDVICRMGGDEFTVLLKDVRGWQDIEAIAEKLVGALSRPYAYAGQPLELSASLGISLFGPDGADPDTLVQKADSAMYEAKRAGKNRYCFSTPPGVSLL